MPSVLRFFLLSPVVGLGRRIAVPSAELKAGTPSSLFDFGMGGLLDIERELSTVAAASQTTLPNETILEFARAITDHLKPQILREHNESQAIVDALLSPFGLCVAPASDSAVATARNLTTMLRAEHRQCREQEVNDHTNLENCTNESTRAMDVQSEACAASSAMWQSVVSDVVFNVVGDCQAAQTDSSSIIAAKVAQMNSQQAHYSQVAGNCTQLTSVLPGLYAACNISNNTWATRREVCNSKQHDFEIAACSERLTVNESCQAYRTCFQYADGNFTQTETHLRDAESTRQSQWRILHHIECMLDALVSGGNASSCGQNEVDIADVTLSYPTAPTQATCPSVGSETDPCEADFSHAEYVALPTNAPPTECNPCAQPSSAIWHLGMNINPSDGHDFGWRGEWGDAVDVGSTANALMRDYLSNDVWTKKVSHVAIARHSHGECTAAKVWQLKENGKSMLDYFQNLNPGRMIVSNGVTYSYVDDTQLPSVPVGRRDPIFGVGGDLAFNWWYGNNGARIALDGGHLSYAPPLSSGPGINDDDTHGLGNEFGAQTLNGQGSDPWTHDISFVQPDCGGSSCTTMGTDHGYNLNSGPVFGNYAIYVKETSSGGDPNTFPCPGNTLSSFV